MEMLVVIILGVGIGALVVWFVENREKPPKPMDWPSRPVDANEASIGTFVEVTDQAQAAAKAEEAYIRSVASLLPDEFILDGVRVEFGILLRGGAMVCVDDEVVINTTVRYGCAAEMKIPLPEIWSVLRPRLQQIADERKAAAEAEKAAKHADILAKLGGGDGRS